jgi:glycosyltransferase involved in cell wall biosynthesis
MDQPSKKPRVIVLMPSYKAGKRVVETYNRIPQDAVAEVIIVDDASPDDTFEYARTLPTQTFRNEKNLGYGGNMKNLLQKGLDAGGDIFIELHADGQYDPAIIPQAVAALQPTDGMLLGSRVMTSENALKNGMPFIKYIMNRVLTMAANAVLKSNLTEFHSGFRVYTRPFLEKVNFQENSNDHLFSFETIVQALRAGFTVREIPVVCTYEPGVTQMNLRKGVKYTVEMLGTLLKQTSYRKKK